MLPHIPQCRSMHASTSGRGSLTRLHEALAKVRQLAAAIPGAMFRGLKKAVDASHAESWFVKGVIWLVRGPLRPALLAFYAKVCAAAPSGRRLVAAAGMTGVFCQNVWRQPCPSS